MTRLWQVVAVALVGWWASSLGLAGTLSNGATHDTHPKWSPDGNRVAYLAEGDTGVALMVAPADGGQPAEVLVAGKRVNSDFIWLSDSDRVVYSTGRRANARLHMICLSSGETLSIGPGEQPALAPGEPVIAATTDRDVVLFDLASMTSRNLTQRKQPARMAGVCWSADGRRLYVARDGDLWEIDRETGHETMRVNHAAQHTVAPVIARPVAGLRGRRIFFSLETDGLYGGVSSNRIGMYDSLEQTHKEIMEADQWSLSPDGEFIVCSLAGQLFYWSRQGSQKVLMGAGEHPAISPQGDHVAFSRSDELLGPQRIVVRSIRAMLQE